MSVNNWKICEADHHLLLSEIQTFHTDAFIKIGQFYTKKMFALEWLIWMNIHLINENLKCVPNLTFFKLT